MDGTPQPPAAELEGARELQPFAGELSHLHQNFRTDQFHSSRAIRCRHTDVVNKIYSGFVLVGMTLTSELAYTRP